MDLSIYGKHFLHHISFKGKRKKEKKRLKNFPERENAINMFCQTNKESNFSIFILRLSYFFFPYFFSYFCAISYSIFFIKIIFMLLLVWLKNIPCFPFFCSFCVNIWCIIECENVCTIGS